MIYRKYTYGSKFDKNGGNLTPLLKRIKPRRKTEREKFVEDEARAIAEGYANGGIDEALAWLSQERNRKKLIRALRYIDAHLPKLVLILEDHPQVPILTVRQKQTWWQGNAVRYLCEFGKLGWLAKYLSLFSCRKKQYAKSECAEDLAEYFRDNYGRPAWQEVGEILLEKFPEAASDGDLACWAKQLAKRKT
jgi:hypothetical protein